MAGPSPASTTASAGISRPSAVRTPAARPSTTVSATTSTPVRTVSAGSADASARGMAPMPAGRHDGVALREHLEREQQHRRGRRERRVEQDAAVEWREEVVQGRRREAASAQEVARRLPRRNAGAKHSSTDSGRGRARRRREPAAGRRPASACAGEHRRQQQRRIAERVTDEARAPARAEPRGRGEASQGETRTAGAVQVERGGERRIRREQHLEAAVDHVPVDHARAHASADVRPRARARAPGGRRARAPERAGAGRRCRPRRSTTACGAVEGARAGSCGDERGRRGVELPRRPAVSTAGPAGATAARPVSAAQCRSVPTQCRENRRITRRRAGRSRPRVPSGPARCRTPPRRPRRAT